MKYRNLVIASTFLLSVAIGRHMFPVVEDVQAKPPELVYLSTPISEDLKKIMSPKTVDTIDVNIDLATNYIAVKGTKDAVVNVTTVNEPPTKWRTKVVEKPVTDNPYAKRVANRYLKQLMEPRKETFAQD